MLTQFRKIFHHHRKEGLSLSFTALVLAVFMTGCSSSEESQSTIVKTDKGYIRGIKENNSIIFKGIPYAHQPTGKLRFKAPVPAEPWKDTLSCENFGSIAAQYSHDEKAARGDENCLSLNLYAPDIKKSKLPVVVWVHGGGMTAGAGKGKDGHAFSDRDSVISITINYRLGVFGFLYLGDQEADYRSSGNNGLLDCIMALQWIRNNISAFGGDPSRVTVMGESAGAKLVSTLLTAPKAKGYFHQLILQSGSVQCIRDSITAKSIRQRLLDTLGLKRPAELLTLSTAKLIEAQDKVCGGARGTNYFGPVQDGAVITDDPYRYVKAHPDQQIRLLMGTNSAESKMFMDADPRLFKADDQALKDWFGDNYRYLKTADRKALATPTGLSYETNLFTQYMYQMHTYRLAKTLADNKTPLWMYRFDYSRDHSGANHGQELEYTWFTGRNEAFNAEELALAEQIHQTWVNFIKGKDLSWPVYTNEKRTVQVFDRVSAPEILKQVFDDPHYPSEALVLH